MKTNHRIMSNRWAGLLLLLLSVALTLPASAYTVTTVAEAPQWQMDWSGNQARPDWTEPDESVFENWTVMLVKIEDALLPYASEDDLLAIFIGDELRGLASPSVVVSTDEVDASQFLLKVFGNENLGDELALTMKYYNAKLRQVFSLSETIIIDEEVLIGFDEDFIPPFTLGSEKFTMTTTIDVAAILASAGITPAKGDIVAAFVGDECRGVSQWAMGNNQWSKFNVYQCQADETITLKYYDSTGNRILDFADDNRYLSGDATGDGIVDVSDYIAIANYIMGNIPEGFKKREADVNGDGVIDVSDYIGVANIILYGNANGK